MERALYLIDRYLGLTYINMLKVIKDSGDFIQGLKRILVREMNSVIDLMFGFGLKVCLAFIALDIVLIILGNNLSSIPIYSKVLALILILAYKYNINSQVKQLYNSRKSGK